MPLAALKMKTWRHHDQIKDAYNTDSYRMFFKFFAYWNCCWVVSAWRNFINKQDAETLVTEQGLMAGRACNIDVSR